MITWGYVQFSDPHAFGMGSIAFRYIPIVDGWISIFCGLIPGISWYIPIIPKIKQAEFEAQLVSFESSLWLINSCHHWDSTNLVVVGGQSALKISSFNTGRRRTGGDVESS